MDAAMQVQILNEAYLYFALHEYPWESSEFICFFNQEVVTSAKIRRLKRLLYYENYLFHKESVSKNKRSWSSFLESLSNNHI